MCLRSLEKIKIVPKKALILVRPKTKKITRKTKTRKRKRAAGEGGWSFDECDERGNREVKHGIPEPPHRSLFSK